MEKVITKFELDRLPDKLIGAAIEVHKNLGPGLMESLYQNSLKHESVLRGVSFSWEFNVPVSYKGIEVGAHLPCDFLVENKSVVELKAVWTMMPVFQTIVLTYMELLRTPKGISLNFNCNDLFKKGQWTYVDEYYRRLAER